MAIRSRQAALTWTPPPGTKVEGAALRLNGDGWTIAEVRRLVADVKGILTLDLRTTAQGEVLEATGTKHALLCLIDRVPIEVHDRLRVEKRLKQGGE